MRTKEYNRDFVQSTGWREEWRREWEVITGELKKYNLNHIELISSEIADVRREKKINGTN